MSEDKTQVIDPVPGKDGDPKVASVTPTKEETDYPAITDFISSIPEVVKESKPGIKTTEFWLTIVISLLTLVNGIPLPDKYEGVVVAALGAAYAISRGIAKNGVASIEPDPVAVAPADEIVQHETGEKVV